MKTKKLEKLNAEPSRLGFGAMRFPLLENGAIDRAEAAEMLDYAYNHGVNYFDTAYGYHKGESEVVLGECLKKYPRDSFYLADKMPVFFCNDESDVDRIFDEQLSRCQVDYFDFYLMHSISREHWNLVKRYSALEKMQKRREKGQIRRLGFSFHGDWDTYIEVLDAYDWDFVQLQYNYIDEIKLDAGKLADELARRGIPLIIMEPVRGGFLADIPEEARKALDETMPGQSSAGVALRWCLNHENTAVVLSGMSSLEQVRENVRVFDESKPLSPEELVSVAKARELIFKVQTVPCTACAYCMDCPSGVNIPKVMHAYNDYKLYRNAFNFKTTYGRLGDEAARACTACGVCAPKCPQNIDIPHWMGAISAEESAIRLD